ncbi:hypothetical protein J3A83DRAFT_4109935, partial [Scleroderma citrinum]
STVKQFKEFSLEVMGQELEKNAPKLRHLVGTLLGGCTEDTTDLVTDGAGDTIMTDNTYWDKVDDIDLKGLLNDLTEDRSPSMMAADKCKMRCTAILLIVFNQRIIIFSILMNSTNQKANAVPSMLGFFFQSMHVPQMVIETLACIRMSISNESVTAST